MPSALQPWAAPGAGLSVVSTRVTSESVSQVPSRRQSSRAEAPLGVRVAMRLLEGSHPVEAEAPAEQGTSDPEMADQVPESYGMLGGGEGAGGVCFPDFTSRIESLVRVEDNEEEDGDHFRLTAPHHPPRRRRWRRRDGDSAQRHRRRRRGSTRTRSGAFQYVPLESQAAGDEPDDEFESTARYFGNRNNDRRPHSPFDGQRAATVPPPPQKGIPRREALNRAAANQRRRASGPVGDVSRSAALRREYRAGAVDAPPRQGSCKSMRRVSGGKVAGARAARSPVRGLPSLRHVLPSERSTTEKETLGQRVADLIAPRGTAASADVEWPQVSTARVNNDHMLVAGGQWKQEDVPPAVLNAIAIAVDEYGEGSGQDISLQWERTASVPPHSDDQNGDREYFEDELAPGTAARIAAAAAAALRLPAPGDYGVANDSAVTLWAESHGDGDGSSDESGSPVIDSSEADGELLSERRLDTAVLGVLQQLEESANRRAAVEGVHEGVVGNDRENPDTAASPRLPGAGKRRKQDAIQSFLEAKERYLAAAHCGAAGKVARGNAHTALPRGFEGGNSRSAAGGGASWQESLFYGKRSFAAMHEKQRQFYLKLIKTFEDNWAGLVPLVTSTPVSTANCSAKQNSTRNLAGVSYMIPPFHIQTCSVPDPPPAGRSQSSEREDGVRRSWRWRRLPHSNGGTLLLRTRARRRLSSPLHVFLMMGGKDMVALDWLPFTSRIMHYAASTGVEESERRKRLRRERRSSSSSSSSSSSGSSTCSQEPPSSRSPPPAVGRCPNYQDKPANERGSRHRKYTRLPRIDGRPGAEMYGVDAKLNVAFILVEYPGYGHSDGIPSPDECIKAALDALRQGLRTMSAPHVELHLVGYSLGSAVALRVATEIASVFAKRTPRVRRAQGDKPPAAAQQNVSTSLGAGSRSADLRLDCGFKLEDLKVFSVDVASISAREDPLTCRLAASTDSSEVGSPMATAHSAMTNGAAARKERTTKSSSSVTTEEEPLSRVDTSLIFRHFSAQRTQPRPDRPFGTTFASPRVSQSAVAGEQQAPRPVSAPGGKTGRDSDLLSSEGDSHEQRRGARCDPLDQVDRFASVALLAPFTSTGECAASLLGLPTAMRSFASVVFSFMAQEAVKWDNMRAIADLVSIVETHSNQMSNIDIRVFHGAKDNLVPSWMSEKLVAHARSVRSDHYDCLAAARSRDWMVGRVGYDEIREQEEGCGISIEHVELAEGNHRNITMQSPFQCEIHRRLYTASMVEAGRGFLRSWKC